jgi:OOP family OmpA-OmpF porin
MVAATVMVALLSSAIPAGAELTLPKLTLSAHVGLAEPNDTYEMTGSIPFGARAGFVFSKYFGLEGSYGKVFAESKRVPAHGFPIDQWGVDLLLNLFPDSRFNPYLLAGWAQLNLDEPHLVILRMNGGEIGAGLKIRLVQDPGARWDLRLDARNVLVRNDPPLESAGDITTHWFFTAGFTMTLGNPDRDSDGDGVKDRFDRCPDTILGAEVDPFGCVLDYDEDGVPDGLDRCPSTPRGATVDEYGCPSDADGDGVMDGIDLCNDTLSGVVVDAAGCALDTDGDGVFDGLDECPGTPPRIQVDEFGCPLTPTVSAVEMELLDTGTLILDNVYFETGTSEIKPESFPILDEVGAVLVKWSELEIEIGGHTDAMGSEENNRALSQERAQAVFDYLAARFPALQISQFSARGYGESVPVTSNDTAEGRARNRRVEFKVLNPGLLKRER